MLTATYTRVIILTCAAVDIMLVSRENCREMYANRTHDLYDHQQPKRPACVHTTRVSSRACELMYAVWHNATSRQPRLPRQSELTDELSFERTPNEHIIQTNLKHIINNSNVVQPKTTHTNMRIGRKGIKGRQKTSFYDTWHKHTRLQQG